MRRHWLRAMILGFLIGPTPAAEAEGADPSEATGSGFAAERSRGHALSGPHFYVWDEDSREVADWAALLWESREATGDAAHWRTVAARTAGLPPVLTSELEVELTARIAAPDARSPMLPLGPLLCLLPSLDRTCLISSWATSPDEQTRRVLARSLAAPFEAVGVGGAIEHLRHDASAEVRGLARAAATIRQSTS